MGLHPRMYVRTYVTYAWYMSEMAVTDARDHLADVVNRVAYSGETTYLTRRGRRMAAIVPAEMLEAIERLEDQIDNEAADAALAEDAPSIPWRQARAELRAL